METLEHPHLLYLNAAQGWLELGNPTEAAAELSRIPPALREHPEVLEVRWQIAVHAQRWTEALALSETLCRLMPGNAFGWIHRSYCLHELKRTKEAWESLVPCAERFPKDWLICYNLACYACQLGWIEQAKSWFDRALELGESKEIQRLAGQDPDLKRLFQTGS